MLDLILNEIKTQQTNSVRIQAIRTLGILGALDPYAHKVQQITSVKVRIVLSVSISHRVAL